MKLDKFNGLRKMFEVRGEEIQDRSTKVIDEYEEQLRAPFLPPTKYLKIDQSVEGSKDVVVPSDILEHFIKKSSHIVIAHACACRKMVGCKDFPTELGCMFLGEPSKKLPDTFVKPATIEEAIAHSRKLRDAGLVLHLGYVPYDAALMGFIDQADKFMSVCGCCPCCSITRFVQYQRMPGVEVVTSDACTSCGKCAEKCPSKRIEIVDGKKVVDPGCLACGWCVESCPVGAIEVKITDPEYFQHTIDWISEKVDVT